jgi:hypothetical protein
MRPITASLLLVALLLPWKAAAQDLEPSYTRSGVDYFSAAVEAKDTKTVPTNCEKQYGKQTEVRATDQKSYRCSINTVSEPRLTARFNEELALLDQVPDSKRQKVTDNLIEKYARMAQCPAGTEGYYDGSMFFCGRSYASKDLCSAGSPSEQPSGEIGCVISTCPKGLTDLATLAKGQQGCFKCPKGVFDPKETEAFHASAGGEPGDYKEVFCRAAAKPGKPDSKPKDPAKR